VCFSKYIYDIFNYVGHVIQNVSKHRLFVFLAIPMGLLLRCTQLSWKTRNGLWKFHKFKTNWLCDNPPTKIPWSVFSSFYFSGDFLTL